MARFWPKSRCNGRVMAQEVFFYQCLWVTKFCAKFGCSRTPRTARAPNSFIVLRCVWKEPAPFGRIRVCIPYVVDKLNGCWYPKIFLGALWWMSAKMGWWATIGGQVSPHKMFGRGWGAADGETRTRCLGRTAAAGKCKSRFTAQKERDPVHNPNHFLSFR